MTEHPDLVEWAMGQLEPTRPALEAHLATCEQCRRDADELRGTHLALERAAPPFAVPPGLEERALPRRRRRRFALAWAALPVAAAARFVLLVTAAAHHRAPCAAPSASAWTSPPPCA